MKVLKEGLPVTAKMQLECLECKALLEINQDDVIDLPDGYEFYNYYVKCPCCYATIFIALNMIPIKMQKALAYKKRRANKIGVDPIWIQ